MNPTRLSVTPNHFPMKFLAAIFGFFFTVATFGEEVAPAPATLAEAIVSFNWSWENVFNGPKAFEEIQFFQGNLARNRWTAHWEITGPRTLTLHMFHDDGQPDDREAYLVFDAAFTHYIGIDFNGTTNIEGFRRQALDPERKPE